MSWFTSIRSRISPRHCEHPSPNPEVGGGAGAKIIGASFQNSYIHDLAIHIHEMCVPSKTWNGGIPDKVRDRQGYDHLRRRVSVVLVVRLVSAPDPLASKV